MFPGCHERMLVFNGVCPWPASYSTVHSVVQREVQVSQGIHSRFCSKRHEVECRVVYFKGMWRAFPPPGSSLILFLGIWNEKLGILAERMLFLAILNT